MHRRRSVASVLGRYLSSTVVSPLLVFIHGDRSPFPRRQMRKHVPLRSPLPPRFPTASTLNPAHSRGHTRREALFPARIVRRWQDLLQFAGVLFDPRRARVREGLGLSVFDRSGDGRDGVGGGGFKSRSRDVRWFREGVTILYWAACVGVVCI